MAEILKDLKAFSGQSKRKAITTIITNPCFHSICLYRLSKFLYNIHLSPISKLLWYLNRMLYHIDIDYRSELAGGVFLVHGLGVVIGKHVVSEGKLTIYQGVTLGGTGKSKKYNGKIIDQPLIKDNVVCYANSMILGPVVIGKNNHIKAGQIILSDIEDYEPNKT